VTRYIPSATAVPDGKVTETSLEVRPAMVLMREKLIVSDPTPTLNKPLNVTVAPAGMAVGSIDLKTPLEVFFVMRNRVP